MFKCLAPMRLIGCLVIVTELTISAAAENKPAQPGPARPEPGELEIEELYPRIFQVTFPSASLKKDGRFVVVLPENWSQVKPNEQRMLVILHGRGRNERTLVEDDRIRQQLLDSGLLLILPRGEDGWYIDSPVQKADLYETHLDETLAAATKAYGLNPRRESWAIAGWSMGGFGCIHYAERHPQQFVAACSIVGLLDFPRIGLPKGQSYRVPTNRFGKQEAVWKEINPINNAASLKEMSVLLITADQAFDRTMNENFRKQLLAIGHEPQWVVLRGGHTIQVVHEALPIVLRHVGEAFRAAQAQAVRGE